MTNYKIKPGGLALALACILIAGPGVAHAQSASCDEPISFWHYYGGGATAPLEKLLNRYTEETGVEVEPRLIPFDDFVRTILQSSVSNDLPEIALVNVNSIAQLSEAGLITEMTDRIDAWGESDLYYDDLWKNVFHNDKAYGVVHVADAYALWYNKTHFAEAELGLPATWDDLIESAQTLTADGRSGIAMALIKGVEGSTPVVIRHLSAGGSFTEWNNEAGVTTLNQLKALVDSGAMSQGSLNWNEDDAYVQFQNEQASMMINSASYISDIREQSPDLEWGIAPLPTDATAITRLDSEALTITRDAACPDAAWELIKWMQQPRVMNDYLPERNKLPVRSDVAEAPRWTTDEPFVVLIEQLGSAWTPTGEVAIHAAEIFTRIQEAAQAAMSGSATPEAAAETLQSQIDAALGG